MTKNKTRNEEIRIPSFPNSSGYAALIGEIKIKRFIQMEQIKPIHAKPSLYAFYFDVIKEIGLKYGYNIVLHGSMNRDLDLIAIPWVYEIKDKVEMLNEICVLLGGHILKESDEDRQRQRIKLYGRECWVININRTIKAKYDGMVSSFEEHSDPQYYIDISILPYK